MLKFAKAIGANTDLLTAQAFIYQSSLAVLLSGEGDDVFIKIRQTGLDLEEEFFSSQEPYATRIPQIIEKINTQLSAVVNLQVLLGFWQGDVLYLYSTGEFKAYLLREGKVSELIPPDGKGQLISGFVKDYDKVLLATDQGLQELIYQSVDLLAESKTCSFEEELGMYLLKAENHPPVAAVLIDNQPEKTILEPNTINPAPQITVGHGQMTALLKKRLLERLRLIQSNHTVFLSKKIKVLFGVFLGCLLLVWIGLSYLNTQNTQKETRFSKAYSAAREQYSKAQNLKDSDPQGAKQSLDEAKKNMTEALKIKPKDIKAQELKKELDSGSNEILKVVEIRDWPLYLSLDLIKSDLFVKKFSFSLGKLLLLDEKQKTLVVVDTSKKTNQILAGQTQLGDASFASLNANSAFVYSKDKGVVKVDLINSKSTPVVKPDDTWGEISDIFGFAGNIYLLDSIKSQIWKYVPTETGYSNKFAYLKPGQKVDLAGAKKLNIDYSVWVLKESQILKFTAGAGDFFSVGGLDKPISEVSGFVVPEDIDSMYVLDRPNNRVVVLKKNGQYQSQITGDKFKDADDFAVDSGGKKLYLLEGNKIYQLDLH